MRAVKILMGSVALSAVMSVVPARAEELPAEVEAKESSAASYGLDEITVVAQKREQNVQDVPISVTAFGQKTLDAAGIVDVRDLKRITPNLNLTTSAQVTNTRVTIRGIGTAGNTAVEPSVGFFVNGAYVPRVGSLLAGMNDVSSVEVLRGPQGTLFGRNASIGAVLLRTNDPGREFEGEMAGSVGNYGRYRGSALLNVPVSDTFALRFSALGYTNDGFGVNDLTGRRTGRNNVVSLHASARWNITPTLEWIVKGDYQQITGDGRPATSVVSKTVSPQARANWIARLDPDGAGTLVGQVPYLDKTYSRRVYQESEGKLDDEQHGIVSNLSWDTGAGVNLKLISSYRNWENYQFEYSSGSVPLALTSRAFTLKSKSHSEEIQINPDAPILNDLVDFVGGLYYFNEDYSIDQNIGLYADYCNVFLKNTSTAARVTACNASPLTDAAYSLFKQTTDSYAAYGQATLNLTDRIGLTGGLRYSKDEKDGSFVSTVRNPTASQAAENTTLRLNQGKFTYRVNATYKPNDGTMIFASYATGFKSGGFDAAPGTSTATGAERRTFNPETTTNSELGIKSQLFDRRVIANVTLYRSKISDLQFRSFDGVQFRIQNNGIARQQGVEFDITARPIPPLTLTFSGAYLDSKYLEFTGAPNLPGFSGTQDLTGTRLPNSPKFQGAFSPQYEGDLGNGMSWLLRSDLAFVTKQNVSASGDNNPDAVQNGYATLGARFALRGQDKKWEVALSGQNLTGKNACNVMYNQGNGAAYGLNNAVTGGTVLRCVLNDPRTVSLEGKVRF